MLAQLLMFKRNGARSIVTTIEDKNINTNSLSSGLKTTPEKLSNHQYVIITIYSHGAQSFMKYLTNI